jgi:hypothetical protein
MTFELDPDLAAVVGIRRAREANEAMKALTEAQLPEPANAAKLALQRALFNLVPSAKETMEP